MCARKSWIWWFNYVFSFSFFASDFLSFLNTNSSKRVSWSRSRRLPEGHQKRTVSTSLLIRLGSSNCHTYDLSPTDLLSACDLRLSIGFMLVMDSVEISQNLYDGKRIKLPMFDSFATVLVWKPKKWHSNFALAKSFLSSVLFSMLISGICQKKNFKPHCWPNLTRDKLAFMALFWLFSRLSSF